MTLTDLIKSAEEKLANPDLTLGTRRREEAILHHLTNLERTVTELESQNTEMYVDLCEMGDMARERSRMREAMIGIDLAGGVDYTVDTLIRHKWPEEKPVVPDEVEFKVYLARYKIDDEFIFMDSVAYYKDTGWGTSGVTHWWNLPEVGNETI